VSLTAAFNDLYAKVSQLGETLDLLPAIVRDAPDLGDEQHFLVGRWADTVADLYRTQQAALLAAARGTEAVGYPLDMELARQSLSVCHRSYNSLAELFTSECVSYSAISELVELGDQRGEGWLTWATGVRQAIENCQRPVSDVNLSLLECWQELAEKSTVNPVEQAQANEKMLVAAAEQQARFRRTLPKELERKAGVKQS
jgi:hypothetical protein